jgi:phenylacetate-coenzyme A ligase PaaK-like adenylate-forming protein
LPRALALHIGGWKKLQSESVSRGRFNQDTARFLGMSQERVLDVYGFSEQGGLLYPDCSQGYKHAPAFAEVFIRNPQTLAVQPDGEEGLVQVLTPLPHSYPGISIITEDVGVVRGRGRCACGRIGTAFQILGRARQSETRGCGDILAEKVRR